MPLRVRAIIIKDHKLLTIKRVKPTETFWCTPGGAIDQGETESQALVRECQEELGVEVKVKELYFKMISKKPQTLGQMEHYYLCDIVAGEIGTGQGPEYQPENGYIGSYKPEWIDIGELKNIDFRPRQLAEWVCKMQQ